VSGDFVGIAEHYLCQVILLENLFVRIAKWTVGWLSHKL